MQHCPPAQQFERLSILASQVLSSPEQAEYVSVENTASASSSSASSKGSVDPSSSLTVIDNRTGKRYDIPVKNNTISAPDLRKITFNGVELLSYDPGFVNTAMATSRICFIDGDKGILEYRGYPIEQLAEKSSFLEVAYLLIFGSLPTANQLQTWNDKVMTHTYLHENLVQLMRNFRYDAHPMGMLISCMSALSTFYAEANPALRGDAIYTNARMRNKQMYRIIGKLPTIAAAAYRNRIGRPYNQPRSDLGYTENFLYMLDALGEAKYRPHPGLVRALDIMFILHADHEMNCSTAAMRHIASSHVDPYSAVAGAGAALYGPLHGGANEAVLHMLEEIGAPENVPAFIEGVKAKKRRLMGFGHRVYHNYDPRAKIIQRTAYEVFKIVGREPLIDTAVALEKAALADEYFIQRKLYPNVDFYSGLIYKAMGFPTDMFPVLFMIPRAVGWLAHWIESLDDPEAKIARPRQVYAGASRRDYVPLEQRSPAPAGPAPKLDAYSATIASSLVNVRRAHPAK